MAQVVLAYSGSVNSSLAIHWLKHDQDMKVLTVAAHILDSDPLEDLGDQALECGASGAHILDSREEFARDYITPSIFAGASHREAYYYTAALARPLIVKKVVTMARDNGCQLIAHGCPRHSTDKTRFHTLVKSLAPDITVINPLDEWNLNSWDQKLRYIRRHALKIKVPNEQQRWRFDSNLWGTLIQMQNHQDSWQDTPPDSHLKISRPENAPNQPLEITIKFRRGVPVALNSKSYSLTDLIKKLDQIGIEHGVGRVDFIQDKISGEKARQIAEAPAAHLIHSAHNALERITLTREVLEVKERASYTWTRLLYEGRWFSDLRQNLDAFFKDTQQNVSGEVRLKLYKGQVQVAGRRSKHSLLGRGHTPWGASSLASPF